MLRKRAAINEKRKGIIFINEPIFLLLNTPE
jgi:hypothetical protein